jgi:DNA-binding NarL/FixJ family response regulator
MSGPPKKKDSRAGREAQRTNKYAYTLDNSLHLVRRPTDSASQENRSPKNDSAAGLSRAQSNDALYQQWLSLSAREQDVIALTCLGYKNHHIAFRLGLSVTTVKSYIQTACHKLNLHSKTDIRLKFYGWDFSAWEQPHR